MENHSDEIQKAVERHFEKFYQKTTPEREFAESTTLHGPGCFANVNKPRWVRLVWVLVFLTCMGVCFWQIWLRVQDYFDFNVNTKITTKYQDKLAFPAVTICNFNRYSRSAVTDYLAKLEGANYTDYTDVNDYETNSVSSSYEDSLDTTLLRDILPSNFDLKLINVTDFQLKTGFQLDTNTLLECTWRGRKCTARNFTHVFTGYGNCYTFNKNDPLLKATRPGEGSGLHVLINIHQEEYSSSLGGFSEAGIKVLAHNQNDIPPIDSIGSSIPPGSRAFMGMRKYEYKNLPPRWGVCSRSKVLKYQENYTLSGCLLECKLEYYIEYCKCKPLGYPSDIRTCDLDELNNCIRNVTKRYQAGNYGECECPIACHFPSYESSISYAAYPNQAVANDTFKRYYVNEEYVMNNFVSLDVYYEELNYQLIEETEAMPSSSLISDIGGQLGLFLGASAITLGELIEYLARRIKRSFFKCNDKRQTNTSTDKPTMNLDRIKYPM